MRIVKILREFNVNRVQGARVGFAESDTASITSGVPLGYSVCICFVIVANN